MDQQLGYVRLAVPLTLQESVLSFVRRSYSVLFQLFARGVTAMPRGLSAELCHAFLVITREVT